MIFVPGLLIFLMHPYKVVDLPLPVGPVTKTIPCGAEIAETKLS